MKFINLLIVPFGMHHSLPVWVFIIVTIIIPKSNNLYGKSEVLESETLLIISTNATQQISSKH